MVQIVGTYKQESSENYKEYLISLGATEELATKQASSKPTIVISSVEGDKVTVGGLVGENVTYPFNKEHEYKAAEQPLWSTVIPNDDGFTFKTKFDSAGTVSEEKVWKFTDTGLVSTSTSNKGVKSVVHYKRV